MGKVWAVVAIAAVLTACGGGGSGGGSTDDREFAAGAAWANLLTKGGTWKSRGTVSTNGGSGTTTVRLDPAIVGSPLPHHAIGATVLTVSPFFADATTQVLEYTSTFEITRDGNEPSAGDDSENCVRITSNTPVPAKAKVGDSGKLFNADLFSACDDPIRSDRSVGSWSIKDQGAYVAICFTTKFIGAEASQELCVEIEEDGTIGTRGSVAAKSSAGTLTPDL